MVISSSKYRRNEQARPFKKCKLLTMSINKMLEQSVKHLKTSINRMSEQQSFLQTEIQRLKDLANNYRERANNMENEIVALRITADNSDAKIKAHLEELVKLDEEMRSLQEHLNNI